MSKKIIIVLILVIILLVTSISIVGTMIYIQSIEGFAVLKKPVKPPKYVILQTRHIFQSIERRGGNK